MKLLWHLVGLCLLVPCVGVAAADEKLVIAHYMTDMVPRSDRPLSRWIDPELADPEGSTAAVGGLQQTVPMASLYLKGADLEMAVDFEIRAARQLGVDGFQFYYPLGDNTKLLSGPYNTIIREFIRQSETRYPGFKVSICLAHPGSQKAQTEAEKIALWSEPVKALLAETADSPAWLRTESGSLLFYLWAADRLADGVIHIAETPQQVRQVSDVYQRYAEAVGHPIDFVFQVRRPVNDGPYMDSMVENFAAVWGWTASEEHAEFWDALAARCRQHGCQYTQTVYPDYYTSKVYAKGAKDYRILSTEEALRIGVDGFERHYRVGELAQTQIHLLRKAIDREATIINYATWNDFPEGHHLAPETGRNFGAALLLRHFKREWQTGKPTVERDEAIVFFKKHRHDAQPKFAVALKVKSANRDLAGENRIELVTLLTEAAECFLNGQSIGVVAAGLQIHSIESQPGKVRVRVVRGDEEVISFVAPEAVSSNPLRTNRLTYSYSSAFEREFETLFGAGVEK